MGLPYSKFNNNNNFAFPASFALHDVERKFVHIFVLQNLSSDSIVSYETSQ